MGPPAEPDLSSTPRLPLLIPKPLAHGHDVQSPERSGMLTPPLYTAASVPFRWEEEPGKPRRLRTIDFPPKCLELPPRLLVDAIVTQLPSPTALLEGRPYAAKSRFQSSSFRILRRERHQLGAMVLSNRGFWGSWHWGRRACKAKRELGGSGRHVFPSSVDGEASNEEEIGNSKRVQMESIRRTGSFSTFSPARSQFWETICEGFKHVVPWRSRKLKKDGLAI